MSKNATKNIIDQAKEQASLGDSKSLGNNKPENYYTDEELAEMREKYFNKDRSTYEDFGFTPSISMSDLTSGPLSAMMVLDAFVGIIMLVGGLGYALVYSLTNSPDPVMFIPNLVVSVILCLIPFWIGFFVKTLVLPPCGFIVVALFMLFA